MLSCCFFILRCIAAPCSLIKMLIQESWKTALHCHGAVSFCTVEYEMHLSYCLFLSKARLCALLSRRGSRENRDKQKLWLTISSFLGTFCSCVRIGNVALKLYMMSCCWLLALLWGSWVLIHVLVPGGHLRKMLLPWCISVHHHCTVA